MVFESAVLKLEKVIEDISILRKELQKKQDVRRMSVPSPIISSFKVPLKKSGSALEDSFKLPAISEHSCTMHQPPFPAEINKEDQLLAKIDY